MSIYNDDLLFIHIPKTGGAAVKAYLRASIPDMKDDGFPIGHIRVQDVERFTGRKPESFKKILAVVRDPYEQRLSQWLFLRNRFAVGGRHLLDMIAAGHGTLTGFLADERARMTNWYLMTFGGEPPQHDADDYLFWLAVDGELPPNLQLVRHEAMEGDIVAIAAAHSRHAPHRLPKVNQGGKRAQLSDYYIDPFGVQLVGHQFRYTIPKLYTPLMDRGVEGSRRAAFLRRLAVGSRGAEIGVWKGAFSQEILDVVNPRRLYLVDPWELNDDETNYQSTVNTTQEVLDGVFQDVHERFAEDPRVSIVRDRSVLAAELCSVELDWVYVDGIHTFPAVYHDLVAWWPHIKPGGMICGDDCWRQEVLEAARVFAEGTDGASEVEVIEKQFIIRKAG